MRFIYTLGKDGPTLYDVDTVTWYHLSQAKEWNGQPTGELVLTFYRHGEPTDMPAMQLTGHQAGAFWRALAEVVADATGSGVPSKMLNDMQLFEVGKTPGDEVREALLIAAEALDVCAEQRVDYIALTRSVPVPLHVRGYTPESIAGYLRTLAEDRNA
jgi:hypothetical protein